MKATIEIECENVREFMVHLQALAEQVDKRVHVLGRNYTDELPNGTKIEDNNCYGTHTCIIESEEVNEAGGRWQ